MIAAQVVKQQNKKIFQETFMRANGECAGQQLLVADRNRRGHFVLSL